MLYSNCVSDVCSSDLGAQRIAAPRDHLGGHARRDAADLAFHRQELRGDRRGAGEGLARGQAIFDEQCELAAVAAMFEDAGVGAEGDRDADCLGARFSLTARSERHTHLFLDTWGVALTSEPPRNRTEGR